MDIKKLAQESIAAKEFAYTPYSPVSYTHLFWIKSLAPASMASRSWDCVPTEETIMIVASGSKSVISCMTALPSLIGITMSRNTSEGDSFL